MSIWSWMTLSIYVGFPFKSLGMKKMRCSFVAQSNVGSTGSLCRGRTWGDHRWWYLRKASYLQDCCFFLLGCCNSLHGFQLPKIVLHKLVWQMLQMEDEGNIPAHKHYCGNNLLHVTQFPRLTPVWIQDFGYLGEVPGLGGTLPVISPKYLWSFSYE